jgi:hypothetical protein
MNVEQLIGKKVICIEMINDPNPIPNGTKGEIYHVGGDVIHVRWENGRNMGLIIGVDKYEIINAKDKL